MLHVGFNPCFSGCWSATCIYNFCTGRIQGFNPCFSGCWSATLVMRYIMLYNIIVSILVLVDVGLRLVHVPPVVLIIQSFNPCFSGCWSATISQTMSSDHYYAVSILVLVDVGLRPLIKQYNVFDKMFQSLF